MKFTKPLIAAATIAAVGSIGFVGAPVAFADPTTQNLGSQGKLEDGNVVQGWTVSNLKVSTDTIPHAVNGTLWEATATDHSIQGGATPIVSNFNARARNGDTYRVLFGAATPQGVNPATLAQGEKTTGKIYFDVTGAAPDSVVYNAGGQDLLTWVQAPSSSGTGGGTGWRPSTSGTSGATSGATGAAEATPAPAAGAEAKPAQPAAVQGAPGTTATEGSQGTPLPAGSQGTPIADGTTAGTPVPAGTPAAVGTPVPAGSQGTPLPAQGQPIPAATEGGAAAPAAATPASPAPAAPTTTVMPAPPAR